MNSSFGLLHNDHFDIVEENGMIVPFFGVSTSESTSIPKSTHSLSILNEIVTYPSQLSEVDNGALTSCLPQWATKIIEVVRLDVDDITTSK